MWHIEWKGKLQTLGCNIRRLEQFFFLPGIDISHMPEKVYEIIQVNLGDVKIVAEQPGGSGLGVIARGQ